MEKENDFKDALLKFKKVLDTGNQEEIEKEKYNLLWKVGNLFELIANYVFLDEIGVSFDFGSSVIKKGTKLFRIRDYNDKTDFSNPDQWKPSPFKSQGRINPEGKEVLYLGSSEMVCVLETHKRYPQKYALGEYECNEDITVGGFLSYVQNNNLYNIAATVLNAFLIAPSRCAKNKELFNYLEQKFGSITLDDFVSLKNTVLDPKEEIKLPYKFALLNQGEKHYDLTNMLCKIMEKQYPEGIRYSSCFIPMETPGIVCSEYNIALYSSGINKLKFRGFSVKTIGGKNPELINDVNLAKVYLGDFKDEVQS